MSADHFAARLRSLREAKGWTQTELAEKAGLTKDGVAHLEQGRRSPAWATVLALAAALEVECGAFAQAPGPDDLPAAAGPRRRGRPKKGA